MAYKKYIKRNGKLYGPYLYESKRVGGKVVSEYKGSGEVKKKPLIKSPMVKTHHYKKIFFTLLTIFIVAILIQIIFILPKLNKISGKTIFEVDGSYIAGETLEGVIKLSLNEGEFIPASSKIIFENSGNIYEFPISQIIKETPSQGDYYIQGKSIVGFGDGYGLEGKASSYPKLKFVLEKYLDLTENQEEEVLEENSGLSGDVLGVDRNTDDYLNEMVGKPSPITGDSIKKSRKVIGSLFRTTGMVSMEFKDNVFGSVSKDDPFIYELKEGEKIELKHGSVYLEEKEMSDKLISLTYEGNTVKVTTDYFIVEKGYGKKYLGDKTKTLLLDLSKLNLVLDEGELNIKLIYGDQEITSISTSIQDNGKIKENNVGSTKEDLTEEDTTKDNEKEINDSPEEAIENIIDSSIWNLGSFLTEKEKKILLDKFGEIQLQNTNSELFNGRIIREYKIGEFSAEYSYDSSLNKDILEVQMERDRIKFLKDIATVLSSEPPYLEPLDEFNENYYF